MPMTSITIGPVTYTFDPALGLGQNDVLKMLDELARVDGVRQALINGAVLAPGKGATALTAVNNRMIALMNALP